MIYRIKNYIFRIMLGLDNSCLRFSVTTWGKGCCSVMGGHPKSGLVRKLEAGNRDIYREYTAYCRYKGKTVRSIERRRKMEFLLLYEP